MRHHSLHAVHCFACVFLVAAFLAAQPAPASMGRIVVSYDDWTLTQIGCAPPAEGVLFAQNVAAWFTADPGSFIGYGTEFHLGSAGFVAALAAVGHVYVRSTATAFTLEELQGYDGVFIGAHPLGSDPGNMPALWDYVEDGGNVYIFGGTDFYGSIAADSQVLNEFLGQYGLFCAYDVSSFAGNYPVSSDHATLVDVDVLYADCGTAVSVIVAGLPTDVVAFEGDNGAVGIYDGRLPESVEQLSVAPPATGVAFPNPAAEAMTIWCQGMSGPSTIDIYACDGRPVRRIGGRGTPSGVRFHWDGRDARGNRVPSGSYWALIEGSGSVPLRVALVR